MSTNKKTPPREENGFIALDENIKQDFELLHSQAMKDLVNRCAGGVTDVEETTFNAWSQGLNVERMGRYCAAVAGLFRGALVKSGQKLDTAAGTIYDLKTEPYFELSVHSGSALAREWGAERGLVRYDTAQVGRHVGLRTGEDPTWGELAWKSIVRCLNECPFPALPGLETKALPAGAVHVRLLPD